MTEPDPPGRPPPAVEIQFRSAPRRVELDEEPAREAAVRLTHPVGWPPSTGVNEVAEVVAEGAVAGRRRDRRP